MKSIKKIYLYFFLVFLSLCIWSGTVSAYNIAYNVETPEKVIALTFDDGPNKFYTEKILAILDREKVKATFFLVGKNIKEHPQIARKIKTKGHELGNHSLNHFDYSLMNNQEIIKDILLSQHIFFKYLDEFPLFFRPPYGKIKTANHKIFKNYFYKIVKWNIDPKDWWPGTNKQMISNIIFKHLKPGSIIIMHDNNMNTLKALPQIINKARKRGFQFVTVSDLISKKATNTALSYNPQKTKNYY
ncbi:polysaccharide deacetylase family protein [bacterium]|nr:polysaccharide deacetylase family protein [bacterium]